MRSSPNEKTASGRLVNGYDYENQAWVENGKYIRCGHPANMDCKCYGKTHDGENTPGLTLTAAEYDHMMTWNPPSKYK